MTSTAPEILARRGLEPALVLTVLVSALVHGGLLALLIAVPGSMLSGPARIESYTVDLIAPEVVGGTNLVAGPGRREAPAAPPPVAPPPEPAPEPVAGPPQVVAPPVVAAVAEAPKPPPPPAPVAEAPKAVAPPEPVAPKLPLPKPAEEAKAPPPKPPPQQAKVPPEQVNAPAPKPPEPKPEAKPAAPKPDAAAAAAKPPKPAVEQPNPARAEPQAKQPATDKPVAAAAAKPSAKIAGAQTVATPARAADPRERQIAEAVQRRAAQVQNPSQRDQQIAAAVQRRAGQVAATDTRGAGEDGGPISVGPGSGAGGTVMDLEFILYQGKMEERIKNAWAWAGADKGLHAVVQFNISPSGEITNIRTVQSSGDRQYDASCERAVRAANPLEPVPEKYRATFATVEMTFKPEDVES